MSGLLRILLISILLLPFSGIAAQDSLNAVVITWYNNGKPQEKKKMEIPVGAQIRIRLKADHHWKTGILTCVNETSIDIGEETYRLMDIYEIGWRTGAVTDPGPILLIVGGAISILGVAILFDGALVGVPVILGGIVVMCSGLATSDRGKWRKHELSPHFHATTAFANRDGNIKGVNSESEN